MSCVFCDIAAKKAPAHIVDENERFMAFLDIYPSQKGQTLIIPKKHTGYIFELSDEDISDLFKYAKRIAKAIDKSLKPLRTCIVVEGFLIDHVHVRLHPCFEKSLRFDPLPKPSDAELKETCEKIRKALQSGP
ncbi:MAG: HIT family protein [archaeon]